MFSLVPKAARWLLVLTLFAPMSPVFAASFTPLGDLPGGTFSSGANGVSDDGAVIVGGGVGTTGPEGFRWTSSGGIEPLGRLLPGTSFSGEATAISPDGLFIAGFESVGGVARSYRWTTGSGLVNLGALAGGGNLVVASAVDVFGDVYGTSDSAAGNRAFRWRGTDSNIFEVGSVPGGFSSSGVTDVGFSGTVETVGFVSSGLIPQAAKISPTPTTVLGDLPGGIVQSVANGVSNNGVVVGYGSTAAGEEAFGYTFAGGMVGLGDLPGGLVQSGATDVSNDGNVIVGYGTTAVGQEAFVYGRSGAGMENLQELLVDRLGAAALANWRLTAANGISGNGRVVVGDGIDPQGNQQAWSAVLPLDQVWDGSAGNTWENGANWVSNFAPLVGDVIQIDNTVGGAVQGPVADANIHQLLLGYLNPGPAALTLTMGDLTITEETIIGSDGTLTIPTGRTLTGPGLQINGLVENAGRIVAPIRLGDLGDYRGILRTSAGQTSIIESSIDNHGLIPVLGTAGSPAEFQAYEKVEQYANPNGVSGLLGARDAVLRFFGGLDNSGNVEFLGGENSVYGSINNRSQGGILVVANTDATFFGTVTQTGSLIVEPGGKARFDSFLIANQGGSGGGDVVFQARVFPGGAGPGSVSFTNNVTLTDAAELVMNIGGTLSGATYDQLNVNGNLALGGTLLTGFEAGYTPDIGNLFDLLNWSGALGGAFTALQLQSAPGLAWDVSQLYVNGQIVAIAAPALPGDYNNDGAVDAADYTTYRDALGTDTILPNDLTRGLVTLDDFDVWAVNFGALPAVVAAVPEPTALAILLVSALALNPRSAGLWAMRSARRRA